MLLPFYHNKFTECGVDEAGRGCFAGPVFAAAVILPCNFHHPLLNDSKQLTAAQREALRPVIEREAVSFAVAQVCNREIDLINILQASYKAMHLALDSIAVKADLLLIDGNRFKPYSIPHVCVVKGDATYASIAAASVLAKTYRDEYMINLHREYSLYSWNSNKGYGTREHRKAIKMYGLTPYHRLSFKLDCLQELAEDLV